MASGGGMGNGMGMMQAPSSLFAGDEGHQLMGDGGRGTVTMHMTFFWGKNVQILFSGWPGDRGVGIYLFALLLVFVVSAAADSLSVLSKRLNQNAAATDGGRGRVSTSLLLTGIHAVKTGLHYLVMLAVMSFNVGVLIAAVAGHAVGFLLAGSGLLVRSDSPSGELNNRHVRKV